MILHLLIDTAFGFLSTIFTLIPTIPAIEHIDYLINGISPMFFRPIIILNYIIGNTFVLNFFFISLGAFALIEWTVKLSYFVALKTHLLGGE